MLAELTLPGFLPLNPISLPSIFLQTASSEQLTIPRVLPIGAMLFQFLFLLVAIPIEAFVLHRWLKFDKKTSAFYAIAMNVFSSVLGWIFFFLFEPVLPINIKSEIINYVFFNRFKGNDIQSLLILTSFILFFATFLMKFFLLKFLIITLDESGVSRQTQLAGISGRELKQISERNKLQNTTLVTTTLIANSFSYTAITILMLIRNR